MSREFIRLLGEASDGQLATPLAKQCTEFAKEDHSDEETTRFLRDLRDLCVHGAGASSFVMKTLAHLLPDEEPEQEGKQRRSALRKKYGMEDPESEERGMMADPKKLHFMERKDGLWEKVADGQVVGLFRTVETKPPKWPGNDASEEKKQEWKEEADRRMERADSPDVEMFFSVGKGPIPSIVFAEPIGENDDDG